MKSTHKNSTLLLFFLVLSLYSVAQKVSDLKLTNKLSILNERVYLQFPANSRNNTRDSTNNYLTIINVYAQGVNITFTARDIFKTATDKLFANLAKQTAIFLENNKTLTTREGQQLQAILTTPLLYDTVLRQVLINTLLVKTKDNSMIEIKVLIPEKEFHLKNEATQLSEQIFQTISSGSRVINLNARIEKRKVTGTQKNFVFKLPENYVLKDESNLFESKFKLIKYNEFGVENKDEFIFSVRKDSYIDFEDFTYWEYEKYGQKLKELKMKGEFLKDNIEWLTFDLLPQGLLLKEQIINCKQLGSNHVIHISMVSDNQKNIKEMTKIVEAIELE